MKVSVKWLSEYLEPVKKDKKLSIKMTALGLEVDNYRSFQSKLTGKDTIIKLDLTPNRGDCFSILGISRELAAINGLKLKLPKIEKIKTTFKLRIFSIGVPTFSLVSKIMIPS